jgi:hypothetical protein
MMVMRVFTSFSFAGSSGQGKFDYFFFTQTPHNAAASHSGQDCLNRVEVYFRIKWGWTWEADILGAFPG